MKAANVAAAFKEECLEIKSKAGKLAGLLRKAARESHNLYERPTRRVMDDAEDVLNRTLALVLKCGGGGVMRVFTNVPAAAFRDVSSKLEHSIGNVSWLLHSDEYRGLPPIAADEPVLCQIWELIAVLHTGSVDDQCDASASLLSLARDSDHLRKLIVEEGGIPVLLKFVREGKVEIRENAARAIGYLGKDPEVSLMIGMGVCSVFANILYEGPMKVQAMVIWVVSELAVHYRGWYYHFEDHNIIRLVVTLLATHTLQEHSRYHVNKTTPMLAAHALARSNPEANDGVTVNNLHNRSFLPSLMSNGARETDELATKAYMKAMATRAIWQVAKGSPPISQTIFKSITEPRAFLCFAVLMEKGPEEARYNSAMALMEITAVAEGDADLRRAAFRPSSASYKAITEQLIRVIHEKADAPWLVPCVKAVGNLARTFRATETRMISPLVELLGERDAEVSREACVALTKFACSDNYLHAEHSRAIIDAGGAKHLVELLYHGDPNVQPSALILLCYIALHMPDHEELAQAEVLLVLDWASKQAFLIQVEHEEELLPRAKASLERHQSR